MKRSGLLCPCLLQMTSTEEDLLSLDHYVRKTFHKTASLMANSCKAIAILGGQDREVAQLAWEYGRHVGLAFQASHDLPNALPIVHNTCRPRFIFEPLAHLHKGLAEPECHQKALIPLQYVFI